MGKQASSAGLRPGMRLLALEIPGNCVCVCACVCVCVCVCDN